MVRLLLVLVGLFATLNVGCGPDRSAYVAANEAILDELPLVPGTAELSRESMSYTFEDGGPFDAAEGYSTRVTYRVPVGTTQRDLIEFYVGFASDSDWTAIVDEVPVIIGDTWVPQPGVTIEPTPIVHGEPIQQLSLCRDDSLVSFELFNVEIDSTWDRASTFAISVDQSYGEDGWRTAC